MSASSEAPETTGSTARRSSAPSAPTSGRSLVFSRSPGSGSPLGCPSPTGLAAQSSGLPSPRPGPADRIIGADAGGLECASSKKDWKSAAHRASNLSELELTLGELAAAVRDAQQSVDFADRSGDALPADEQTHDAGRCPASGGRAGGRPCPLPRGRVDAGGAAAGVPAPLLAARLPVLRPAPRRCRAHGVGHVLGGQLAATDRPKLAPPLDALREVEQRAAQALEGRSQELAPRHRPRPPHPGPGGAVPGHSGAFVIRAGP